MKDHSGWDTWAEGVGEKEGTFSFIFYSSPCQQLCILNKLTKWGKDNTHFNFTEHSTEHIQEGQV